MALATLSIDLEARLAKMEQGFDKANRLSEKFAADQERRFSAIKSTAGAIGIALAGAFSVTQLAQFARATIDGLDALNDLKDATGASIENISALEDVAARTGTSFESMASTLVKFNKVLSDAEPGSAAANTIKLLGLSAEELKRIDPAEALRQTAVALSKFADDGNKARVIQELFGKSVQEAAPFLKDLAEQGQLNATVTTAQAQAAEDFNKQLFQLEKNLKDTGRSIVSEVVPALNQLFAAINGGPGGGESQISKFLAVPLQTVSVLAANVAFVLKGIGTEIGGIAAQAAAVATLDFDRASSIGDEMRADAKAAREEFDRLEKRLMGIGDVYPQASYSNEGRARPAASIGGLPGADTKAKASEFQRYVEQLEKATLASLELSTEEQARLAITSGELGKLTEAQKEYVIQLARGIDLSKQAADLRGPVIDPQVLERRNALEKELNALIASTPTEKLRKQKETAEGLAQAFKDGTILVQQYHEALGELVPLTEQLAEETNEFAKEAAANIQDALGDTLKRTLKGDFDSIGEMWQDMLFDMVAQAMAAKLNQALFGSDFGSTGNIGGLIGGLLGGGGGGSGYPTIGGGAGDIGGYVIPTMSAASAGGRMSAAGARQSVVIDNRGAVYNVGSNVSRAEVEQAVAMANARTEEKLRRSLRQGVYS